MWSYQAVRLSIVQQESAHIDHSPRLLVTLFPRHIKLIATVGCLYRDGEEKI